MRLIAVFVAVFSAVTVIAVVILTARIRIEPFILVRVFASLTDSILIASSIADIAVVPIVRLVVDLAAAVVPAAIPISVTIIPAAILALVARSEAILVSIAIGILERLHWSHPLLIATSGLSPVRALIIVRVVLTPFMLSLGITIAVARLLAVLTRLPRISLIVTTIVIVVAVLSQ
jgi:hypothetical protein